MDLDERNFHGWGYRQFVVQREGAPPAAEEAYTAARIGQNFSNYSAWHARTALLRRLHASSRTVTLDELVAEELATPSGAVFAIRWHWYSSGCAGCLAGPSLRHAGGSAASMVPTWALREEYALVQQAFFTDPMDQSAWLYHRWLLGGSLAHYAAACGTPQEGAARQARTCCGLIAKRCLSHCSGLQGLMSRFDGAAPCVGAAFFRSESQ